MFVECVDVTLLGNSSCFGFALTTVGERYSLVGSDKTHFKGDFDRYDFIVGYFWDSIHENSWRKDKVLCGMSNYGWKWIEYGMSGLL
jgi:hypothetical protein